MGGVFRDCSWRNLCFTKKTRGLRMKRAELTTQQIITIIILIISFAVILFFIFRMNFGEIEKKEICHNSVLLKSSNTNFLGSLNCKTTYVCISGGDDCDGFSYDTKIKIELSKTDEEIKNQIFKAIADEMSDCWWMFGEGKTNYFFDTGGYHCAICSKIKFDKKIQEKFSNKLDYLNLYQFLTKTKKDKAQTYLYYLYGLNGEIDSNSFLKYNVLKKIKSEDKILFSEEYSIVTGINYEAGQDKFIRPYFVKNNFDEWKLLGCDVFDISLA